MTHSIKLFVLAMALNAFAMGCEGCEEKDDETIIKSLVVQAADLAQKHAIRDLMKLTTEDFIAQPGFRDRQQVKPILLFAFKRYKKFTIKHPTPSIEISSQADEATVSVPFLILPAGKKIPDLKNLVTDPQSWAIKASKVADPYHLKLELKKTNDGWKVKTAVLTSVKGL